MAYDYDALDNSGSGFGDDEEDANLDYLLNEAYSGQEHPEEEQQQNAQASAPAQDDEEDFADLEELLGAPTASSEAEAPAPAPAAPEAAQAPAAPAPEPTAEPQAQSQEQVPPQAPVQEVATPVVEATAPAPVASPAPVAAPASVPAPAATTYGNIRVPSESDEIAKIARIVLVLDAIRALDSSNRDTVAQVITPPETQTTDEATYIYRALNADQLLVSTVEALRRARELNAVERAFYLMGLEEKLLRNLGNLTVLLSGEDIDSTLERSEFARQVVYAVEKLDNEAMSFVRAAESVFAAAKH